MTKCKVYLDWEYKIDPSSLHEWENSSIEDCDLIISVNRITKFNNNKRKVLWLYEPRAICPEIYNVVEIRSLQYEAIATHVDNLKSKNNCIIIPPCFPSWISKEDCLVYEKNKNLSMIASSKVMCNGHRYRQEVATQLEDVLDLFGFGRSRSIENKISGLKNYRFSIAMENSLVSTYYTEKIIDCFLTGTIPIYWGCPSIGNIFDSEGIIDLKWFIKNYKDFNYEAEYNSRQKAISNNFQKALDMNLKSTDGVNEIVKKLLLQT